MADLVDPEPARLVVRRVHGHPEPVARPGEDHSRTNSPGPVDGLFLEVVPEAEVAQHLEERVMPGGVADVLEVVVLAAGAHAALARGRSCVVKPLAAGQRVLELDHAGHW